MEYNKLVSVVMPVHNGEKFLREAIESVLNQTYTNFEFLIIENCSNDSSLKIIQSYNDPRIHLIIETNCGIPQAYNRGFKEAKGEFIVVHDQDDISLPVRIEQQLDYLLNYNLDFCGSAFTIVNEKNEEIKKIFPPESKEDIFNKILFDFFAIFNPTLMIKKEVLERLGYFNEHLQIGSDYDFLLRCLDNYKCGNIQTVLLKYRFHQASTSKQNKKHWKNDYEISLKYFEKYKTRFNDSDFIRARIFYYYGFYLKASLQILKSVFKNGITLQKMKYLLYSTIFAVPVRLLRKTNMFFNKRFNLLIGKK